MVKMVALYRRPPDPEAFMAHYTQVHLPLARQMPGLRRIEFSRFFQARGRESDPFLMAELYFDSKPALWAAIESPAGKESGRDLQKFAGDVVQIWFAEVETEEF